MISDRGVQRVLVGVDGSEQALAAAEWGALEASRHAVDLNLLYVVDSSRALTANVREAEERVADTVLRDAHSSVNTVQRPIKVVREIFVGDPGTVLLEQSRSAALLCLGAPKSVPHGPSDSLAAELAKSACCTVAVIPSKHCSAWASSGRAVCYLGREPVNYDSLQIAIEEADLHGFSLDIVTTSAICTADETLIQKWSATNPAVDIKVVLTEDLLGYVARQHGSVRSIILGAEQRTEVESAIELARARPAAYRSPAVLVVRGRHL